MKGRTMASTKVRARYLGVLLGTAVSAGMAGCGAETYGPPMETEPVPGPVGSDTARDRLADSLSLDVSGPDSTVEVAVTFARGTASETTETRALTATGGAVVLSATDSGALNFDDLDTTFGDIPIVPADAEPTLALTGLAVSLAEPALCATNWSAAGDAAFAESTIDLRIEWSLVTPDGTTSPLAPQIIEDVPVSVRVWADSNGAIQTDIAGGLEGTFWSLSGVVEMSDLSFTLRAAETAGAEIASGE